MLSILGTLTSCSDSNFERWNISFKENKRDGDDLNSNGLTYCVRKNEGKILWFSADWNSDNFWDSRHINFMANVRTSFADPFCRPSKKYRSIALNMHGYDFDDVIANDPFCLCNSSNYTLFHVR